MNMLPPRLITIELVVSGRTIREPISSRKPSRTSSISRVGLVTSRSRRTSGLRICCRNHADIPNVAEVIAITTGPDSHAISVPASAGPVTCASETLAISLPLASARCLRWTRLGMIADQAALKKTVWQPSMTATSNSSSIERTSRNHAAGMTA